MVIHNKTIAGLEIDPFANSYVDINDIMVRYFKTHRHVLYFDSLFLRLLVKENKYWNKNHLFIIYK